MQFIFSICCEFLLGVILVASTESFSVGTDIVFDVLDPVNVAYLKCMALCRGKLNQMSAIDDEWQVGKNQTNH